MFFVYILYSPDHDRHYIGQTQDVRTRLHRHNSGYEESTSPYRPWELQCVITKFLLRTRQNKDRENNRICFHSRNVRTIQVNSRPFRY